MSLPRPQNTKAMPPKACDICGQPLKRFPTFFDGRVNGYSSWAWMCNECWNRHGIGLGTGLGQEYNSTTNEKLRQKHPPDCACSECTMPDLHNG